MKPLAIFSLSSLLLVLAGCAAGTVTDADQIIQKRGAPYSKHLLGGQECLVFKEVGYSSSKYYLNTLAVILPADKKSTGPYDANVPRQCMSTQAAREINESTERSPRLDPTWAQIAMKVSPSNYYSHYLAILAASGFEKQNAIDKAIGLFPAESMLQIFKAQVVAKTDANAALAILDKIEKSNPGFVQTYVERGKILQQARRTEAEYLAPYDAAIKSNPSRGYTERGNAYFRNYKMNESIDDFKKAAEESSPRDGIIPRYNRISSLYYQKRYDEMLPDVQPLTEVMQKFPGTPLALLEGGVHYMAGHAMMEKGKEKEGCEEFKKAVKTGLSTAASVIRQDGTCTTPQKLSFGGEPCVVGAKSDSPVFKGCGADADFVAR